jgi:hypothetical protein
MTRRQSTTRRRFLKSATAAALIAPLIVPRSALGADDAPPPSERVTLSFSDCGRQ